MTKYASQTYNNPSLLNSDPGDPVTSELAKAQLFNPRAIAQAATGADTMEQAWHFITTETSTSDVAALDFNAVDVSGYDALMIVGGFNLAVPALGVGGVVAQVDIGGTWTTFASYGITSGSGLGYSEGVVMRAMIDNLQAGSAILGKHGTFSFVGRASTNWNASGTTATDNPFGHSFIANHTGADGVRVATTGSAALYGTVATTVLTLYGQKKLYS